ncbi:uncharacterized protein N7500_008703 [Penicillium coprophilum]|uniref:uncharacterized protein n=1 Tax=Penicillium coprophilum TaxID=36646 RepID=UPI00239BB456|nr:uncharacterized protein N7500_008703 [Penicillium coprophilum]KAJ5159052.1 hypothetical protein N7500_008703 [Penicillium coprophilum]
MPLRYKVLIPDKHLDRPIYKLINSSELGTKANPIMIGDNPTPLGSASNPIEILIYKSFLALVDKRSGINSNYLRLVNKALNNRATKVIEDHPITLYSQTSQGQKTLYSTTKRTTSKLPSSSYGKRKLSDTNSVPLELRRSRRLIKRAR